MRTRITAAGLAVAGLLGASAGTATAERAGLDWGPCQGNDIPAGMRCATIDVPVDWSNPDGRTITLDLARLTGTDPSHKIGTVFFFPGGPGGSGIDDLKHAHQNFAELRTRFDIVSFAPRNVAPSTALPMRCVTSGPWLYQPESAADFVALNRSKQASIQDCRKADPELFDNLDSASVARDADAVREALGAPELSVMSNSYGGVPAAGYARLFPERVRAMYLDGGGGNTGTHAEDDRTTYPQSEQQFARLADWCAANSSCVLHGEDVAAVWQRLIARADRDPIPVKGEPAKAAYTGFDLKIAAGPDLNGSGPMPEAPMWQRLTRNIDRARHGDAGGFAELLKQGFGTVKMRAMPGLVTECLDGAGYRNYAEYLRAKRRGEVLSENFAGKWQVRGLSCAGWPSPVTNPRAPLPGDDLPPLLGAGTWEDLPGTEQTVKQVPGSRTVRFEGQGHGLYLTGERCTIGHVNRYLIDLTLPAPATVCRPSDR